MSFKVILLVALVLASFTAASAADLVRIIPSTARMGNDVNVTLQLRGASVGDKFVVGEELPDGALLQSWEVSGANKSSVHLTHNKTSLIWELTATDSSPSISYIALLPLHGDNGTFDLVYAGSSGERGHAKDTVAYLAPLPVVPAMFTLPPPKILSPSAPAGQPEQQLPYLLLGSLMLLGLGVVAVVERKRLAPYGHDVIVWSHHLLKHDAPVPVLAAQSQTMHKEVIEQALEAAELAKMIESSHADLLTPSSSPKDTAPSPRAPATPQNDAHVWSASIFKR